MWNVTKTQAYIILIISICSEVCGSCCLEACNGFEYKLYSLGTAVFYGIAFYSFSKILHIIDLAVAYATWTAVGSIATAVMSQFVFHDPLSKAGWAAIVCLCIGVIGLNLFGTPKGEEVSEK